MFRRIVLLTQMMFHFIDGQDIDIRCYACTTIDANAMLSEVADPNWLRWLENVRYVPFSQHCKDNFEVDLALRDGVRSHECINGVCMKMTFLEKSGATHVWRNCIPQAKEQIRSDCTKITSGQDEIPNINKSSVTYSTSGSELLKKSGNLEVCTCDSNLCNSSTIYNTLFPFVFSLLLLFF